MIPLLTRIDNELATCTHPGRSAELWAERASYLARTGEFTEAHEILARLRQGFGDGRDARVSVRIMLLEGLLLYFEKASRLARDRVLRAKTIASAVGIVDLSLLSSAWLAHMEFECGNYSAMFHLLESIVCDRSLASPDLRARTALVIANALSYCGNDAVAQRWFEACRQACVDAGDRATMGAVMYNRVAFRLARLWVRGIAYRDAIDVERINMLEKELESAWAFQVGTSVSALSHLTELSRARILMLKMEFSRAADVLSPLLTQMSALGDEDRRPCVVIELAYCRLLSSQDVDVDELLRYVDASKVIHGLDVDERMAAMAMILELAEKSPESDFRASCARDLNALRTVYEHEIEGLRTSFGKDAFQVPPDTWSGRIKTS